MSARIVVVGEFRVMWYAQVSVGSKLVSRSEIFPRIWRRFQIYCELILTQPAHKRWVNSESEEISL
jgi:hypothetical protein